MLQKHGLNLWATAVFPSLFPFFVAVELLSQTNIIFHIGKLFHKLMKPIFNVPGIGSYPLIMGLISGYPVGAKIVADLKEKGKCTEAEAERLLAFTNNSGPLFILGTVGVAIFSDTKTGALLLATHILATLTVRIFISFLEERSKKQRFWLTSAS